MATLLLGLQAIRPSLAPDGRRALARRWAANATLVERLRDDDDRDAAADAAQTLYDRLRAGALDAAALTAAARAMWSARVGVDDRLVPGGVVPISLQLRTPSVIDPAFARPRDGPELEWRLAEATLEDGRPLELSSDAVATTRTPLTLLAPTVWCHATVPRSTSPGRRMLRLTVEFAVRPHPSAEIVGRWTQQTSQPVEVVADRTSTDRGPVPAQRRLRSEPLDRR